MRATPIVLSLTTLACLPQLAVASSEPSTSSSESVADQQTDTSPLAAESAPAIAQAAAIAQPETLPVERSTATPIAESVALPLHPTQAVSTPEVIAVPPSVPPTESAVAITTAPHADQPATADEQPRAIDSNSASSPQVEALESTIPPVSRSATDLLAPEDRLTQLPPTNGLPSEAETIPELQPEPLDPEDTNAELGEIRILPRPAQQPPPRPQPDVQVLLRSGVFTSSNITALDAFKTGDTVFSNTALLLATPKLGPTTRLVAAVGGGAVRFATEGDSNYNLLEASLAVQQRLTANMYAQLGWAHEQLYRDSNGQRSFLNNAADFTIGRQDQLGKQLRLDSFYNLRASFSNPTDQSRVAHTLGTRLRYDFTPSFQGALDYRLTFKDFTEADRFDTEHQLSAIATYSITPNLFVAGSVSYLLGQSSNPAIDINNFSVGFTVGLNVPLF